MANVTIKETPGGTAIKVRVVGGEDVQQVEAAIVQRTYYTGAQQIDLQSSPTVVKTLTVPSGARFATARLEGSTSTDFARFYFVDTPSATVGEPLYHQEELDILEPATFKVIKGTGSGTLTLWVQYYDVKLP